MCGIAGIANRGLKAFDTSVIQAMSHSIRHRGPDDLGYLGLAGDARLRLSRDPSDVAGSWLGLAHRRLSILDLSDEAWQPMCSTDNRYVIVYNGEVYNYVELREQLQQCGYHFRSTCDTEVVLNAYMEWGADSLTRFVGMFAFAILDLVKRRLFLARDHFGIKPLYYCSTDGLFAFASEIKALLEIPGISRNADVGAVLDYLRLARNDGGETTFFASIKQLPAAHSLEVPLDTLHVGVPVPFWHLSLTESNDISYDDACHRLRDMLLENVRLHLRSDVPVGAALSGGIDSSSIVACIREVEPETTLHTFTYLSDGPDDSELLWAREVSDLTEAIRHMIEPSEKDMVNELDELVYIQDQPFGSTNMYAQYLVYRLAHQSGVKVVLDGQGADELMAGYSHFYLNRVCSMLKRRQFARLLAFLRSSAKTQPAFRTTDTLLRSMFGMLPAAVQQPVSEVLRGCPSWINKRWIRDYGIDRRRCGAYPRNTSLREALYKSLTSDSLPMLLRWQDRNSMAHSVESRVPFLTPDLAEYLMTLPEEYFISSDGTRKSILRTAMSGIVPRGVLTRLDKVAFGSPMAEWLQRLIPWGTRLMSSDALDAIPVFDGSRLRATWQEVVEGRRSQGDWTWRWISLIKWVECFNIRFA